MNIQNVTAHVVNRKWSNAALAFEAKKYLTRSDFRSGSSGAYLAAVRRKILDDICVHMSAQRQSWADWTIEDLQKEAQKYTTRGAFSKGSSGVYQAAYQRGVLDQICGHMHRQLLSWDDWTLEDFRQEAQKYPTRFEFKKRANKIYQAAHRRGILGQICDHMLTGRAGSDSDTVYLWKATNTAMFKVGVTSSRLNLERLNHVASLAGLAPELVIYTTCSDPRTVEKQVLDLGVPVKFNKPFNGSTEFRWMCPKQLAQAVGIIASNSWLN